VIYFDAAYVAKCYLNEPGGERVRELARGSEGLASCEAARLEVFAAVHRHLREGDLQAAHVRQILDRFEKDEREGVWSWYPVTSELVRAASHRFRTLGKKVYLRALDALHLECASAAGFSEVYTNDRHMVAAAPHFAIVPRNVIGA
jgi:predicted nucleic acid-binding protein